MVLGIIILALSSNHASAAPVFGAPTSYSAGSDPRGIAIGDLNEDGRPDLIIANTLSTKFSVLLGNAEGAFEPKTEFDAGDETTSATVADMNRDGHLDVIVTRVQANAISVFFGAGDGSLALSSAYLTWEAPVASDVADFNGDGWLDVVVADAGGATGGWAVSVLLATGSGALAPATRYVSGQWPVSVVACDLDGDGRPDYVRANNGAYNVSVSMGNGDGTFQPAATYLAGGIPNSVAVGDLNGDGHPDLVASANPGGASVWLGIGDGSFGPASYFPETAAGRIELADLDRDEILDLVVANGGSNSISVLRGVGDGTLAPKTDFPAGTSCHSVASGDFNGDGLPDLAVTNGSAGTVSVLLNQTQILGVESGIEPGLALEGFRPNPASVNLNVAFTLARSEPAVLELLDLSGRRVVSREVGGLGAGRHVVSLPEAARVASGIYWLRLRQGTQFRAVTSVVIR